MRTYNFDSGEICFDVRKIGSELVISISDNGVGIEPEEVARINKMNFEDDSDCEIVGNVIERHNGSLWIESTVNIGTVFSIYIPVV